MAALGAAHGPITSHDENHNSALWGGRDGPRCGWQGWGMPTIERMFDPSATAPPPRRAASPGSPGAARGGPPGWPPRVPPPEVAGWQVPAVAWLLDQCPADYRTYAAWRRHPLVLAWLTVQHLEGQLAALRTAYRGMRVDLADQVAADALTDVLEVLSAEGARLDASRRSASLVLDAMEGKVFVPRL